MSERRLSEGRLELRSLEGAEGLPSIRGYAAVFYRAGDPATEFQLERGVFERIMPGAFDKAIRRDDVRATFNHKTDHVLGRTKSGTLALAVDDIGLRYEISPSESQAYRELVEMIRRGDIDGSSFSFKIDGQDHWGRSDGKQVREVRNVKLFDVGPVVVPAYAGAIAEARAEDLRETRSQYEAWQAQERQEILERELTLRRLKLASIERRRRHEALEHRA